MNQRRVTAADPDRQRLRISRARRWLVAALPVAAIFLTPPPASAAPEHLQNQQACAATLKKVKEQEQTGSLLEAKDLSLSCSRAPCTDFVRRQCATEHAKLEADTPTVVFVITDASGASRSNDVQV